MQPINFNNVEYYSIYILKTNEGEKVAEPTEGTTTVADKNIIR